MSGGRSDDERLRDLRFALTARDAEISRLRREVAADERTIEDLRHAAASDRRQIDELSGDAEDSDRIERAQRALIARLRDEVGERARSADDLGARLRAAEHELADLRAIRDALLPPTLVQRDGMTIAAELIPAESDVGGDFFFVGDGPNGTAVMAVGDVVGHGLSAARRCAFTRTALASVAPFSEDPSQLLRWVNVALVERIGESADFVTAACLTYDPATRLLRLASAGHHPALRLSTGEELQPPQTGAALGLMRKFNCTAYTERVPPGKGLLLFTDGVIEARGPDSRYGTERLADAVRDARELPPLETLEEIKRDLRAFAGESLGDDVCLLALRGE